jgi:prepilin peptidase CpaA
MFGVAAHLLLFVFPIVMVYAAALDLVTLRISNYVPLGLAAAFLLIAPIAGMPLHDMLMHLGVGAAVLVVGIVLFSLRLVGGGDAKLLAAAALWIGYAQLLPFLVYVTVFGGALALLMLAYRQTPATALPLPEWALRLHKSGEGIPYGIAITAGALVAYPLTNWPALLAV